MIAPPAWTPPPPRRSRAGVAVLVVVAVLVGLCALAGLAAGAVALILNGGPATGPRVAILDLSGVIGEESGISLLGGAGTSARQVRTLLRRARENSDIRAVVLRINSPGGEVVASQEIYEQVQLVRRAGKPVVVSMAGECASGGYYIASAADWVVANPDTLTGSIGVILRLQNLQGLYAKAGVTEEVIKSGPHKDFGSRPLTPEERDMLQKLIDDAYGRFVGVVASGRHLPEDRVRQIADGSVYDGSTALGLGLVDETGNLDQAVAKAGSLAHLGTQPETTQLKVSGGLFGGSAEKLLGLVPGLEQAAQAVSPPGGLREEYMLYPPGFFN